MKKTVDNGCTENEAIAASAKVTELLHKHQLTLSDIKIAKSECIKKSYDSGLKTPQSTEWILGAINELCDTKGWLDGTGDTRLYVFFGLEHDVMVAHYICKLCDWAIVRAGEEFKEVEQYMKASPYERTKLKDHFKLAMAYRLAERIRELKKKQISKPKGRDLVVLKSALIEKEFKALSLNLKTSSRSGKYLDPVAAAAGYSAAENVSLNPGVTRGGSHNQIGE